MTLDKLTIGQVDMESMDIMEQLDYLPIDPVIKRPEGTVKDTDNGEVYKASKGGLHVRLKLVQERNGCDIKLTKQIDHDVTELGKRGISRL